MNAISRFVPAHSDKHASFQMISEALPNRGEFISAMQISEVKAIHPFLQGHSENWAMIEFWTSDLSKARIAAEKLAGHFGSELRDGDFTRNELGLV